ncbi:ATP-binding cassette domain-containing protein [Ekhidna sp.]|uniref:ATP-binding cassette domain-containing protein n=1 Tax=Ekhidna sp. TaxID=2608089 RepID=UPI003CCC20E5
MLNNTWYSSTLPEEYHFHFCLKVIASCFKQDLSIDKVDELIFARTIELEDACKICNEVGFNSNLISINDISDLEYPALLRKENGDWICIVKKPPNKNAIIMVDPIAGELTLPWCSILPSLQRDQKENIVGVHISGISRLDLFHSRKENFFNHLKSLQILKIDTSKLVVFLLLSIVLVCLQIAIPLLSKVLIDNSLRSSSVMTIIPIIIAQLVVAMGKYLAKEFNDKMVIQFGVKIGNSLYSRLFDSYVSLSTSFVKRKSVGIFQMRAQDIRRIQKFLSEKIPANIIALLLTIALGVLLLFIQWEIFILFVFFIFWEFVWLKTFRNRLKNIFYTIHLSGTRFQQVILDFKNEITDLRMYQKERYIKDKLIYSSSIHNSNHIKSDSLFFQRARGTTLIDEIRNISITCVLLVLVIQENSTIGDLFAVQFITGQLSWGVNTISNFSPAYQDFLLFRNRHFEFTQKQQQDDFETIWEPLDTGSIKLNNISYSYENASNQVFDNLKFEIPAQKVTLVAGSNGSGKTTLLRILATIVKPTQGEVIFDSDLKKDFNSIRENIAYLGTESNLLSDTLLFNITLGNKSSKISIDEILDFVALKKFTMSLPYGLETVIGKNGLSLSKGQEQKILLARTIYQKRDILIMDEPSTFIDHLQGNLIDKMIKKYFADSTVIITSHDSSLIGISDYAIVLGNKTIVEEGATEQLIAKPNSILNTFINS